MGFSMTGVLLMTRSANCRKVYCPISYNCIYYCLASFAFAYHSLKP